MPDGTVSFSVVEGNLKRSVSASRSLRREMRNFGPPDESF